MPPGYVKTIREEILYEYAKLISRSTYGTLQRGFITERFKKLRDGEITISGTIREWEREQELPKQCVYCGSITNLTTDHLIPRSRGGDESADNVVLACQPCNTTRGDKGIFEWLGLKEKDKLHRLVAGKYLKQLLTLHEQAGTLEIAKDQITVLCAKCALPKVWKRWGQIFILEFAKNMDVIRIKVAVPKMRVPVGRDCGMRSEEHYPNSQSREHSALRIQDRAERKRYYLRHTEDRVYAQCHALSC
jgi:hypothetical protein